MIPTEPIGSIPRPPELIEADQRIFVGVVAPIDLRVETPEEVRDRDTAFAKIRARVLGTAFASNLLGSD
jgi:hypothetical protein